MKPFIVNRYDRIVFPGNFFPELDFSVFETLEQFAAVINRDFEDKAPTEADIVARLESGATSSATRPSQATTAASLTRRAQIGRSIARTRNTAIWPRVTDPSGQ